MDKKQIDLLKRLNTDVFSENDIAEDDKDDFQYFKGKGYIQNLGATNQIFFYKVSPAGRDFLSDVRKMSYQWWMTTIIAWSALIVSIVALFK